MLYPEIAYWLSRGETIFKHRGTMWLCLRHVDSKHRIMIEVFRSDLEKVNKRLYVETPLTIRGADGTVYTN
jgi:hypothetical protein